MIYTDQIIIHMLLGALSELIKKAISHQKNLHKQYIKSLISSFLWKKFLVHKLQFNIRASKERAQRHRFE